MTRDDSLQDLEPRAGLQQLIRYWWVLALGIFLGGVLGWLFSLSKPPVYEATAYYEIDIYEQGLIKRLGLDGPEDLTFQTVNPYLQPVADLFYASDISTEVIAALAESGIRIEPQDFNTRTFILDRRGHIWFVSVRDADPERAVRMADIWLATVDERLLEFQTHAFAAQELQIQFDLVQYCFKNSSLSEGNLCAGTSFSTLDEFGAYLADAMDQLSSEQVEARGLDPLVSFYVTETAVATETAMLYAKANLLVAGGTVGLLLALVLVLGGFIPACVGKKP